MRKVDQAEANTAFSDQHKYRECFKAGVSFANSKDNERILCYAVRCGGL